MKTLWIVLAVLLAAPAAAQEPLKKAEGEAREAARRGAESVRRHQSLERLRKDLRYIAEDLDRELLDEGKGKDVEAYAVRLSSRVASLRERGSIDARLEPALGHLERLYSSLPQRPGLDQYPRGFGLAVSEELRAIAEEGADEADILRRLDEQLELPIQAEALLPVDLPLPAFRKLGPIRIFLVKHRLRRPASHAVTTAPDIAKGRHNVQAGVEVDGTVTRHYSFNIDGDYTFDLGDLHLEVTPEWRLLHPGFPKPRKGDRVRVKGWTYFDSFHKAEEEYDPADPVLGAQRVTLWEVHPVQEIEILATAPGAPEADERVEP